MPAPPPRRHQHIAAAVRGRPAGPAVKRASRTLGILALIGTAAGTLGAVYVRWAVKSGISFFEGTKR